MNRPGLMAGFALTFAVVLHTGSSEPAQAAPVSPSNTLDCETHPARGDGLTNQQWFCSGGIPEVGDFFLYDLCPAGGWITEVEGFDSPHDRRGWMAVDLFENCNATDDFDGPVTIVGRM